MKSEQQIIQEIADKVFEVVDENWLELKINYQVDDVQSQEINTYLTETNGTKIEKSVPFILDLDFCLRELREFLSQGNKEKFNNCILHFKSNGEFNADYSYDPINWDVIDENVSNFANPL